MSSETMRNNTTGLEQILAMANNLPDANSSGIDSDLNVLVIGDSLFGGNTGRTFLDELGCNIENLAVVGASLSEVATNTTDDGTLNSIGTQMYSHYYKFNKGLIPEPDVILMDGGGNDYILSSPMGNLLSDRPTHYIDGGVKPSMFDFTTVMGGLEKVLHYASYYKNAQKFFLIMHRVNQTSKTTLVNGKHCYWSSDKCNAGYNYDTLRENIIKACNMYGVKVIDIYNDSCLSMIPMQEGEPDAKDGYWHISGQNTKVEDSVTVKSKILCANLTYFDWKGIHPTLTGYRIGYKKHILQALRLATKKGVSE